MRVCAITNVYNESFNLPIWLKYYGNQVALENCIVIDHGSNDGSTKDIGSAGRVNMPREKFDDSRRAAFISDFASSMLRIYDAVIYSDCDELLVPDPSTYSGLIDFCERMRTPCATAIGVNLVHDINLEKLIDPNRSILRQRNFLQFVSPMCKSTIIRQPIVWGVGFHSSNLPPAIYDLYLIHLRWVDIVQCLKRLNITQSVVFSHDGPTYHHNTMNQFIERFQNAAKLARKTDFDPTPFIERVAELFKETESGQFVINGDVRSPELFCLPDRFRDAF